MKGDDKDDIQKKTEALMQASHKLAEQIYKQTQAAGVGTAGAAGTENKGSGTENVVDAEFQEVKDDNKK